MDVLKAQLNKIQQQLAGLTASQRMLAGSIVVIMVLTLMFWARYAATAEMEMVLDQPFSSDEIARVTTKLASRGISYQVRGDRVLVPADRRFEVLADLSYDQLLPRNTETGYDVIAKQMSPWDSSGKMAAMFNQAKQLTLAQVIRNFPNVANATVVIDPKDEVRIGGSIAPTALVSIQMRGGAKPDGKFVNAAADVVAGAVAGIPRKNVAVVIDGYSYPVADRAEGGLASADAQFDLKYAAERKEEAKIRDHFSFIRGLIASVTVDLNVRSEQSQETVVDPKNFLHKEMEIHSRTEENTSAASQGGEPGAMPNMGMAVQSAGGQDTNSTVSEETSRFQLIPSQRTTSSTTPAGKATVVSASVRVPRSYFVGMYRMNNPASDSEPSAEALKPVIDSEIVRMREELKTIMMLQSDASVSVAIYADAMPPMAMATQTTSGGGGVALALGDHVKEIALGGLALVSLFMVSMMVKKGGPTPTVIPVSEPVEAPRLASGEHLAGEVGEGSPLLDGMELDDDAVKAQQMIGQVSTLVKDNPDAAANLVKRWLNRV